MKNKPNLDDTRPKRTSKPDAKIKKTKGSMKKQSQPKKREEPDISIKRANAVARASNQRLRQLKQDLKDGKVMTGEQIISEMAPHMNAIAKAMEELRP